MGKHFCSGHRKKDECRRKRRLLLGLPGRDNQYLTFTKAMVCQSMKNLSLQILVTQPTKGLKKGAVSR